MVMTTVMSSAGISTSLLLMMHQPTALVTLTSIAEDGGARLITQAELLANASDIEGDALTATGLTINTGNGAITDNGDGTWNYTPAADDDTDVSFNYTICLLYTSPSPRDS